MSLARRLYSALVRLAIPAALVRVWWRGRREPDYRRHVGERLGFYPRTRGTHRGVIWLHAVSVGETRAAEPLVRALIESHPRIRVLLTHTTATGRQTSEALFGDSVLRVYLPYDSPGAVARFLDAFEPRIAIVMETEVWPNLLRACAQRAIPSFLVNARLSEKSFRGYRRIAPLAREAFGALTLVAAQTHEDAARLKALGANDVRITGNVKFDVAPPEALIGRGRAWREGYGERNVLLAASTRDGEEALLLDALAQLDSRALLVIVPRHPQRFDEVAALLESRGVSYARRSRSEAPAADVRVLLGDSMGEMAAYYAACDVAFIGGSLLPFGAQNLIEACALGKPVLLGPSTYNFAEASAQALAAGAALRVETAEDLMRTATGLFAEPARLAGMGSRAAEFAQAHRGATARVLDIIEAGLPRPPA